MDIKPITIKPLSPAPAPAAPAAAAPAPAPAAPPAGIRPISIKPAAPTPLAAAPAADGASTPTIRLKPVAPAPIAPLAPAAAPAPAAPALQAMKGKTSRISLDQALSSPPTAAAAPAMGKLTSNLSAAAQAAKGQTAKVSLTILDDDAMTRHQTLRMKAPAAKPAAPAAPKPAAEPADSEAPTVRRKTLVLKKEGADDKPAAAGDDAEATKPTLRLKPSGGGDASTKPKITLKGKAPGEKDEKKDDAAAPAAGADGAPADGAAPAPGAFNLNMIAEKPEKTNVVFPLLAIASILVCIFSLLLLTSEFTGQEGSGEDLSLTQMVWRKQDKDTGKLVPAIGGSITCPGLPRVTLGR